MNNQHVSHLLAAYHDGELQGRQLRQVESHLAECKACQVELQELQTLSSLLHECPPAADLTPPDRFVAQVQLRLPGRPEQTFGQKMLNTAWWLAPVGLAGTWVFIQTTLFVTGVVLFTLSMAGVSITQRVPELPGGSWLARLPNLTGPDLAALDWLGNGGRIGWGLPIGGILSLAIGLLYMSWLATWWVRQQSHQQES